MKFPLRFWFVLLLLGVSSPRPAHSHPMGNFSINHFARFEPKPGYLALRTALDFAEIPTGERMPQLDTDGNDAISATEKRAFLSREIAASKPNYQVRINGKMAPLMLQNSDLELLPGAGGLQTLRVIANWKLALPDQKNTRVDFTNANFPGRNGWMEIVARGGAGREIANSDAETSDRSRELRVFSLKSGEVAPRQREASFSLISAPGISMPQGTVATRNKNTEISDSNTGAPDEAQPITPTNAPANARTPQNRFTQSIAEKELTPGLVLGGLLAALAFGAVHALAPGHGKTMVAAYLVGSRGTPRHAITLGLVVTITHTLGVFALGLALLFASRYVVPERLFPALSAASGLLIFGVGLWLFMSRYQDLTKSKQPDHHSHDHDAHDSAHHNDDHEDDGHVHSHGGHAHSHTVPDGPITLKTLIALGISGGIVPCPEALVVLLAAVKLHRIGYGMLLITAFSLGLAAALIAIGLIVVAARSRFGALSGGKSAGWMRFLPLGSAAAITLIGIVLTLQATGAAP